MRRAVRGLALLAAFVAVAAIAPGSSAPATGPEPAPATKTDAQTRPRTPGGASSADSTAASPVVYESGVQRDERGIHYYAIARSDQFNYCVWGDTRHGADITIPFKIDEFKPVDAQGHPAPGNPLFGKQGRLEIVNYDIDDKTSITPPEIDQVYLGAANAAIGSYDWPIGKLTGQNDAVSTQAFSFPMDALRPKSAVNPTGLNEVHIDVDTANNGGARAQWCAGINEVIMRLFDNEPLPVVLVHGFTSESEAMDAMKARWEFRLPGLMDRVANPDVSKTGGVQTRYPQVDVDVQYLLDFTGRGQVNLVGHSFGGLTVRWYALLNPNTVANVAMLGAPNGGDNLADAACIYLISPALRVGGIFGAIIQAALKAAAEAKLGKCVPGNAIFQMTTPYMRYWWNARLPDPGQPKYWALAGDDSSGFKGWLASQVFREPNDGLVEVASALWKRPSAAPLDEEPSQPGNHTPIGVYHLKHGALRTDSAPLDDTQCRLYPETCDTGPLPFRSPRASAVNGGSGASDPMGIRWTERIAESARSAKAATQSLAEPSVEVGFGRDLQLEPGQSQSIPLAFENADEAAILVFSDHAEDLTASFAGTPLGLDDFMDAMPMLGLTLSPAANGTLQVTNNGTATAVVRVLTSIPTNREVTVSVNPALARPGTPVTLTTVVSEVDPGDAPHLAVVNEADQIVHEVDPALSGTGTWTATWTPPASGSYNVVADLGDARPRTGHADFTVASGAATIATGLTEQLVDENHNGLTDALVVRPNVTVTTAGPYVLTAGLQAGDGTVVAAASASVDLAAGVQSPELRFDGRTIYDSGRPGPYRVVDVAIARRDTQLHVEDAVADVGATGAHAVASFEHDRVLIDRAGFSSRGVDSNSDGRLEQVNVTTNVSAETAGSYTVTGELRGADGSFVASRFAFVNLNAGANSFELAFFGTDIARSGKAGPFTLAHLSVTRGSDANARDAVVDAHTTEAFPYSAFAGPDVTATATVGGGAVTVSIPSGTQHGRISFAGTAGQNVAVELTGSTLSGDVEVRGPDNRVLMETFAGSGSSFVEPVRLAATGTHTLVVDPSGAGSITLRLYAVPADATGTITAGGAAVSIATTVPGQKARLTFTGSSGQRISAKLTSSTITSGNVVLVRPDGSEQASGSIDAAGGFLDVQSLPMAGTYTLLVDPAGAATGSSSVNLYSVPADVSTTIRYGRTVNVTTTTPGQNAKLPFSANANDKVSISLTSTAITAGTLALLKPDGTTQASTAITTSGAKLNGLVLAVKGTYTILVDPARWATGTASVSLNTAADVTGTITAGGAAVTKSTTVAGQNIRLTFTGSVNQRVSVKTTTTSGITSGTVSLLHPDGSTVASASISANAAFVDTQTLPAAGTYTILIDPSGDQVGSATTNLYNVADTTGTIVPGGPAQTVTLNTPGQNGRLTFTGSVSQRVSVSLSGSTLSAATVRLLKPDGTTQASTTIGTGTGSIPMQVLPVAGTYTILVDPTGAATGAVTVTLGQGPADVTGTITPGGAPLTVTMSTAEQNARITFTGAVGQRVSLKLSSVTISGSTCCSAKVSITNPDGTTLLAPTYFGTSGAFVDTKTLTQAGTHTILVDPQDANTGSATLTLYDVPADAGGPIVAGGAAVTLTAGTPGQNGRLTFTGAVGQLVSVKLSGVSIGTSSCCSAKVSITNPDGTTLVAPTFFGTSGGFVDTKTLGQAGTYAIVIDPQGADTGSATVDLYNVPADAGGPIVPGGAAVSVTAGTPGQNAKLTFTGAVGQRVSLELTGVTIAGSSCCSARVSITNPDGTTLVSPTFVGTSGGYVDTKTLAQAGTYTILLDPEGSNTGSATLRLHDVPADFTGTIQPGGPAVTVTAGTPGQNAKLTFAGAVGQRVSLNVSGVTIAGSSCCSARVSITNPDGTALVAPTFVGTSGTFVDTKTLAQAGTYTILLDPENANTGSATLTLYDVPADVTGSLLVGGPGVTTMMSTPGQNARLTLDATAGQQRTLTLSGVTIGTSSCCSARVSILNPDGTTLVSPSFFGTSGKVMTFTPTATGTHTIVLDPDGSSTGGVTTAVS